MGKPSSAYGRSVVLPGSSGFRPTLLNERIDINEIFLNGPLNPYRKYNDVFDILKLFYELNGHSAIFTIGNNFLVSL